MSRKTDGRPMGAEVESAEEKKQPDTVPASAGPQVLNPTKEKYFRVRFQAKSRPEDDDDVTLSVNGKAVVVEREKIVVLPERYVVCAQNAHFPQFRQLPNQPRKVVGKVLVFPMEIIGEATEGEFLKMLQDGTQKTNQSIERETVAGNS